MRIGRETTKKKSVRKRERERMKESAREKGEITRSKSLDDRIDPTLTWARSLVSHGREMSTCHWQGCFLVTLRGFADLRLMFFAGLSSPEN